MKKKRSRVPGEPRSAVSVESGPSQHTNTLEEVVRSQRDVQFNLEKRVEERKKRRKLATELSTLPSGQAPAQAPKDARAVGLEVWRKAAARRKQLSASSALFNGNEETDGPEALLDERIGAKIVDEARRQRLEIHDERVAKGDVEPAGAAQKTSIDVVLKGIGSRGKRTESQRANRHGDSDDDDEDDDDDHYRSDIDDCDHGDDTRSIAMTEFDARSNADDLERDLDFLDGTGITEEEEVALSLFKTKDNATTEVDGEGGKLMLADIIVAKIREKEEADAKAAAEAANPERAARDRKIAEVYGLVGNIMSRYRSGRVPKALKVIPKMPNWEELIYLTRPDEWSPAAVYIATRVLASNLPAKEVVSFYSDILLPRCLEDIADNKKLNYHLYRALEKAVYKPEAFSKGILFPLCEDNSVTFRQACIIGSVVMKVSIPMLHSAAALFHIAQLSFSATSCAIMKALIEKKYALPYRVVDAVVDCFVTMKNDERPLPLLWHQCLLAFAQRYKMELTRAQKERLKVLMRAHTHNGVTPEIRRELFSTRNRGDTVDPDANTIAKNMASATATVDV